MTTISTLPFISVNTGATANDGTGDPLQTAFIKVNANFGYMANTGFNAGNILASGTVQAANVISGTLFGNVNTGGTGSSYAVGYLNVPQNATGTGSYVATLNDQGQHLYTSPAIASNVFISNNAITTWPVGTAISIINAGPATITITGNNSVSLYLAGNTRTGSNIRILAAQGMATILNVSANVWYVNGTGLT